MVAEEAPHSSYNAFPRLLTAGPKTNSTTPHKLSLKFSLKCMRWL